MKKNIKTKTIFLDRDGTIMKDKGYLGRVSGIEFYKDTVKVLKLLQAKGYKLIGVSNQSGIGRGLTSVKQVEAVNKAVIKKLKVRGVNLLEIYYCPHLPGSRCICRKPKPGMVKKAVKKYNLELSGSYVLGDKMSDVDLARNSKMTPILMLTGKGRRTLKKFKTKGILKAATLTKATKHILHQS